MKISIDRITEKLVLTPEELAVVGQGYLLASQQNNNPGDVVAGHACLEYARSPDDEDPELGIPVHMIGDVLGMLAIARDNHPDKAVSEPAAAMLRLYWLEDEHVQTPNKY